MRRFTVITVVLASTVAFLVGLILAGQFTPTPVVTTAPRLSPPRADPRRRMDLKFACRRKPIRIRLRSPWLTADLGYLVLVPKS